MPAERPSEARRVLAAMLAAWLAGGATAAAAQNGEPAPLPPLETLSETVERPLFMADRRPPPVDDTEEETKSAESGLFTLVGIIMSPTQRIALVKVRGSQEVLQLAEGQQASGWTVLEIRPQEVIFESNDKTETIELIDVSPTPPRGRPTRDRTAPAPAAPAPPQGNR